MKKLNYEIILYNIAEAREQLDEMEKRLKDENLTEIDFQILLEHAYHHMNFAWNIRHTSIDEYKNLADENFNKWSKFPIEIMPHKIEK